MSMLMRSPGSAVVLAAACCLGGCGGNTGTVEQYEMVPELITAEDIPAGSVVKQGMLRTGKLYFKKGRRPAAGPAAEEAPSGLFPGGMIGILEGKKVGRALKKGEVVKAGDITEPDGSPFRKPPGP